MGFDGAGRNILLEQVSRPVLGAVRKKKEAEVQLLAQITANRGTRETVANE